MGHGTKTLSALIGIAALVNGLVISNAWAQDAGVANPTTPIENFDIENIGPVLDELGIAWQANARAGGQSYVIANVGNVVQFMLAPVVCRSNGVSDCIGLNMVAVFDGYANPQTVKAFNFRYPFASAGLDAEGTAFLNRYEISDYGVARGNLATSIKVFANQILMFKTELETARKTVSLDGYLGDMSSRSLNAQMHQSIGGTTHMPASVTEQHQMGLEQSAELVQLFISDTQAPRNKIENIRK